MREYIYEIFGIGDYEPFLEKYNPNFKIREEQNKLVYDMVKAFRSDKKQILMEAPTGTGKTFIYTYISLVEYIVKMANTKDKFDNESYQSIFKNNKIVIVTNNKALQKQIHMDILNVIIPSLIAFFEYKGRLDCVEVINTLKVGIYKSKSNYLCVNALNKEYENKDKDNFYNEMQKEILSQDTNSVDFDLVDRFDNNNKAKFNSNMFEKFNAKNRNCQNCKKSKCKFRKNESHNIMITNYDYLLLLSQVMDLDYIYTLILDEVHNLPNKLINISSDEFNLTNFLTRLPKGDKDKLINDFTNNMYNIQNHLLKTNKEELYNITYGITQDEGKNLENYNKTLKLKETELLLSKEEKRVNSNIKNLYIKDLNMILEEFFSRLYFHLYRILKEVRKVDGYINQELVIKQYDKIKSVLGSLNINDYIENLEVLNENKYLSDMEVEKLDKLFSTNDNVKDSLKHLRDLSYIIKQLFAFCRITSEIKNYINYIKELKNKLEDSKYEMQEIETPDVITVNNVDGNINITIMNDDTVDTYSRFLRKIYKARHIVYCSATMSIEEDYSFFMDRLGLINNETYKCYIPNSPFDKFNKRYIFLDKDYCLDKFGRETKYKWILEKQLHKITNKGDSGSLILCTSRVDVDNSYNCLQNNVGDKYSVHSQYYSSLPTIMNDTNNSKKNTIVIGNTGFWEGIDFKGDNMTNLIITKLPYMRVNEPSIVSKFDRLLFDKVENKSKKSFIGEYWNYYNNMMKIVFYQGVGRLIRSVTDYGVIVCLFSYENFSKKFNVDRDKHLGITDISVMSANSLNVLELLIESSLQITKQNSNKFRK